MASVYIQLPLVSVGASVGAATEAKQDSQITQETAINASTTSIDSKFTTLNAKDFATSAKQDSAATLMGSVTETAPASDTASSGHNGRLQRIAQRITSLIALFPTSLGSKAAASSFAVTSSTEDTALMGSLTETAPASDTASSGHNGRLQRIAQRLTSLIALFPTALGQGTMATSFKVVLPSDQPALPTKSPVNTAGSVINGSLTATTASSESTPANTIGFILQAPSTNTDNVRYRIGGTASTTAGVLMEPGRDTGFIPCNATLSICATASGTNKYEITWILSA
jgi:hypothetical protein